MGYRLTFDGGKTKICPPKDLVQALDTSIEKTPNYR